MALMKFREPNQVLWQGVKPAHKGIQITEAAAANDSEVVIYTVPPGKIFYLVEAHLRLTADISGQGVIYIFTAVPGWLRNICSFWFKAGTSGGVDHFNCWPPIEVSAGYTVRVFSSVVGFALQGSIFGWYEQA